jgi:hypothetical protein
MAFPITFSIPEEKIVNKDYPKTKIVSSLIPGVASTYIYDNEEDYYNEYRQSYFAITKKKGGWDCMRHYEIMANGCLPFFIDVENCPKNTMGLCPKELFLEANSLYYKFVTKDINSLPKEFIDKYNNLRNKLLDYTRNHLTTAKMAQYILETTGYKNVKSILYLSGDTSPDYLRCVTLHGFKTIFGEKCHDYPKIPHIYKTDHINYKSLYGKGITYTNLLDENLHDDLMDNSILPDIISKKYDIIIYGSFHRGIPFYDVVSNVYKPNEIILLCGEDDHVCCHSRLTERGHRVFVREL